MSSSRINSADKGTSAFPTFSTGLSENAPVSGNERIVSLDVIRGAAVLGILLMNIWSFGWPKEVFDYPLMLDHLGGATSETWAFVYTFFEGSQRALFSMLFGAGTLLLLARLEARCSDKETRVIYYRRTGFLILFGLVDAYIFLWPADILYVYGLAGLCLYPFRKAKVKTLIVAALIVFSVPTLIRAVDLNALMDIKNNPVEWQAELSDARPQYNNPSFQESIAIMQDGSFEQVFKKQAVGSLILQTIVTVKWWFMDALGGMLIGMILYKLSLLAMDARRRDLKALMLWGYAIGVPISIIETYVLLSTDFEPVGHALISFTYDIGRFAMAFGHLALISIFCNNIGWQRVKQRLACVGRMAMTNYLAQSILCGFIFYSFGLGLYGKLPGIYLYAIVLLIWAIEIYWSKLWLHYFKFGPFEWVWRSLTYMNRQPMLRKG